MLNKPYLYVLDLWVNVKYSLGNEAAWQGHAHSPLPGSDWVEDGSWLGRVDLCLDIVCILTLPSLRNMVRIGSVRFVLVDVEVALLTWLSSQYSGQSREEMGILSQLPSFCPPYRLAGLSATKKGPKTGRKDCNETCATEGSLTRSSESFAGSPHALPTSAPPH